MREREEMMAGKNHSKQLDAGPGRKPKVAEQRGVGEFKQHKFDTLRT